MQQVHDWSLTDLAEAIRTRKLSPVQATHAMLSRIDALDGHLASYATVAGETAIRQARAAEAEIMAGHYRGPLHGVPIAIKDLFYTKDITTAAGTAIHRGFMPHYDATVVTRLQQAGAVLLGKLAMTEAAVPQHHPSMPLPKNPWDAALWPGVSSSGCGVATAAGLCFGSLGSDTGGSIRYPSSCNGLTGVKTTTGLVSRHGVFPLSASFDSIGPIARSAADAAVLLGAIAGWDEADPTTDRTPPPDYTGHLAGIDGARGLRIGIDPRFNADGVDPAIVRLLDAATMVLADLGAEIVDIDYPDPTAVVTAHGVVAAVEMAAAHRATYPSRAGEYGPWLAAAIEAGHAMDPCRIGAAHAEIQRYRNLYNALFARTDAILTPVASFATPTWDEANALVDNAMPLLSRFTAQVNATGTASVTLPCGFTAPNRPMGLQLAGPAHSEALLLRIADAYQHATDWHLQRPIIRQE
jgi:amidase